jgi:hypothetical protein
MGSRRFAQIDGSRQYRPGNDSASEISSSNRLEQGTRSGSPSLHDNSLEINRITSQAASSLP